jgi:glutamine---fructose-6-phosphate transaminase (isomerizing)
MAVMAQLEGAYSLLFKSTHYPGQLVGCKRGSPLILGIRSPKAGSQAALATSNSKHDTAIECFLASDASAMIEHTKKVVMLEDGDVVALRDGAYEIFNFQDGFDAIAAPAPAQRRALQVLNMEVGHIMKGGYEHFMQKEIFEQPETVLQTMRGRVRLCGPSPRLEGGGVGGAIATASTADTANAAPADVAPVSDQEPGIKLGGLTDYLQTIRSGRRLILVGCGTSYHACLASRAAIEDLVGIPTSLELASDMLDRCPPIFRDDTCVFVSQSGETADTLRALEYAKSRGALCVGITNTVGSAIARSTHCGVHINAGCEIGVASTKAYTSQIVVLVMMSLALCEDSISRRAKRNEIIAGLARLPAAIQSALRLNDEIRALAQALQEEQSLLVFGRGCNYATALEAALKVKEVALMHSEGILAGEMKHGPLALVDESMPILVIATQDAMHAKMLSVIQQLRARGARLIVLAGEGDAEVAAVAGEESSVIFVPRAPDYLQPVVNAVPLQLLAYHLAVLRGLNVDQPRNLAKSVTVSEEKGQVGGGTK